MQIGSAAAILVAKIANGGEDHCQAAYCHVLKEMEKREKGGTAAPPSAHLIK
jgi:hypothetical protein